MIDEVCECGRGDLHLPSILEVEYEFTQEYVGDAFRVQRGVTEIWFRMDCHGCGGVGISQFLRFTEPKYMTPMAILLRHLGISV